MIYRRTPMAIRGTDKYGSGVFGAARGGRAHKGVDLVCEKGDVIYSPVYGKVTKIGLPYGGDGPKGAKRYVEVEADGKFHRFFYVRPLVRVGQKIYQGSVIGDAQGLQDIYPGITDHIHYEIKLPEGGFEDPTSKVL